MVQSILPIFQLVLTFGNICVLAYALVQFLNKPHTSLEERVNIHDIKIKEIENSLKHGNDKFREQEEMNEILLKSLLALIEFEMQFCLTEDKPISKDLEKAKDDLHAYLTKRS